jgi:hypothetical protein
VWFGDQVTAAHGTGQQVRMSVCGRTHAEERRHDPVSVQRFQYAGRAARIRAVVECERDLGPVIWPAGQVAAFPGQAGEEGGIPGGIRGLVVPAVHGS